MQDTVQEYIDMLTKLQQGIISEQQWMEYCSVLLSEVMEANKDVYIRMKERGD
jgi:hypothetical protein